MGLVPFFMRVHTPGDPRGAPWVSDFCETNVRTYAVNREGRAGIWFLSLDAARLGAVAVDPASFHSRTTGPPCGSAGRSLRSPGPAIRRSPTRGQRRLPGPRTATSQVRVHIGTPYQPAELGDRDHFLTSGWVLFSVLAGRQFFARAEHQPWPLYRGEALTADDSLMTAAGLPDAPRRAPGALRAGGRRPYRAAGEVRRARGDLARGDLPRRTPPAGRPRSAPPGPGRGTSSRPPARPAGSASRSSTPGRCRPRRRPWPTSTTPRP